jgi:Flp pilus assembly protein CpaB
MNKNTFVKFLGVAVVVAIISTGLFYGLFASRLSSSTGSGHTLVVAAKALKAGTVISAEDLKTVPWPAEHLPKGSYESPDGVVGSTVFDPIGNEEPVMATHLASAQSGGGSGVPEGMRAVSVHVADSTGVMALLGAGQKVDVQVVTGRGVKPSETQIRTALENISVLSVTPQPEQSSQGHSVPVVTLLVKPAEADILAAADSGAIIRLALRNPLDNATRTRDALPLGTVMRSAR